MSSSLNWIVEAAGGSPPESSLRFQGGECSFVCAAVAGKWRCVCYRSDNNGVYRIVLWNHVGKQQAVLDTLTWGSDVDPLIQLAAPKDGTTVWIYAVVGRSLWAWKPEAKDFAANKPVQRISCNDIWTPLEDTPSRITAFTVRWTDLNIPTILLGTESGLVLWVKQGRIPHALRAYKVALPESRFSNLLSSVVYRPPSDTITSLLSPTGTQIISLIETGKRLDCWAWEDGPSGPVFRSEREISLYGLMDDYFRGTPTPFFTMKVLNAQSHLQNIFVLAVVDHRDSRPVLYWLHFLDFELQSVHALDQFLEPHSVFVFDHLVSTNGIPYAMIAATSTATPVLIALRPVHGVVYHALDSIPQPLARSCFQDPVTHGVVFLDSSFSMHRARVVVPEKPFVPGSRSFPDMEGRLFSVYDEWYKHQDVQNMIFPPTHRTHSDREACIVSCARKIQHESSDNPMARHLAYIEFLQNEGLYKYLSLYGKWSLMAIGQEICAFKALTGVAVHHLRDEIAGCQAYQLEEQMGSIQKRVLDVASDDNLMREWLLCLITTFKAAMEFRETRCSLSQANHPSYLIVPNSIPLAIDHENIIPVWTSQAQHLLLAQVTHWSRTNCTDILIGDLTSVLQYALQTLADSTCSVPENKPLYVNVQKEVFELAHSTGKCDQLLFQLCLAHNFFHGLCEITSKYAPGTFDLISLSGTVGKDVESGESFETYVIKWFAERNKFGLASKYGMAFPYAFDDLIRENYCGLGQYRWMLAVRQNDFGAAADSLLVNAKDPTKKLEHAEVSLSLAKLVNSSSESNRSQRAVMIDKSRELLMLQKVYSESERALTSKELLNLCLGKIDEDTSEEVLDLFFNSLAVCTTFPSDEEVSQGALLVWFKSIVKERAQWIAWLKSRDDLSDQGLLELARSATLFGKLVDRSLEVQEWGPVHFNQIYSFAKTKWGLVEALDREIFGSSSMIRLLGLLSSSGASPTRMATD